jgi:hypothetical protein
MNPRFVASLTASVAAAAVLSLASATTFGQSGSADDQRWKAPRTADGQPDLQGYWTSATYTPLERPAGLGDKAFFTPEEAEAYAKTRLDRFLAQPKDSIHYDDAIWQTEDSYKGTTTLRTSLIVDPSDGRVPALTAEAQARAAARAAVRIGGSADSAENRGLSERCIKWASEGPPMLPPGYYANYQFVQGPGYVAIIQEMTHNTRIVPLDGSPHVGSNILQWSGDSRGHWEGDTLIVETTNFHERNLFRGATESMRVTERFTRVGPGEIRYAFTVSDPATWARSWSAEVPMRQIDGPIFEYACHEGNYGLANILRAARVGEAAGEAPTADSGGE